jgi:aerobic-type carbon monoxide dehydrogenase small subunit (CoxS/CutS family)
MSAVVLTVNGTARRVYTARDAPLLLALRDELGLTGAKYGCGEGACGACTVLVDGRAVRSCVTTVSEAAGKKITTVEGLEREGRLHPVQQAFLDEEAFQCGYCTPGMVLSAVALLEANPDPGEEEILRAMDGNLCRCGTYSRILTAVRRAALALRKR